MLRYLYFYGILLEKVKRKQIMLVYLEEMVSLGSGKDTKYILSIPSLGMGDRAQYLTVTWEIE